jgi:uncharacterized membrane protein
MLEAKLIGFKEGLKVALVWLVYYSYLVTNRNENLIKPFKVGLVTAYVISVLFLLLSEGYVTGGQLGNFIEMSFVFFLFLSAAALLQASGTNLLGPFKESVSGGFGRVPELAIVFLFTIFFFLPDSLGALLFLRETAFMKETGALTYAYAFLGFSVAVLIVFLVFRFYRPYWIGGYFDLPQLLLFLAIVKLLGGGTEGIAELSIIPSVQQGLMKFIHDFIHQTLVLVMVPDHPLLKATTWNFIGIFFGSGLASIISLVTLLCFPLIFLYYRLFKAVPEPDLKKNVERRKIKALMISDRRRKALPILFFIGLILIAWFSERGETVSQIYEPESRPVVAVNGVVAIPLKAPAADLMDGRLYKFSLTHEGEQMRIIIIRKADNTLSVALDACQICPPDGYAQRADHVVCLYCYTPISINSMGLPGGCNPVPLEFVIEGSRVKVELKEIIDKWGFVTGMDKKMGTDIK